MIVTRALSRKTPMSKHVISCIAAPFRTANFQSSTRRTLAIVACVTLALIASPAAHAASINYGTFNVAPAGIMFQNVTESSGTDPVPLFGPPDPYQIGLDFDPTSFVSSSTGGSSDVTDGQLNFTIMGVSNPSGYVGITGFSLFEAGDYSLVGTGTNATLATAGAIIRATVTQVNGLPVAPIALPPVNASVGFNLVANPGVVQPWSLGLNIPVNLPQGQLATKIEVSVDNSLISISQASSVSFIAKKDFRIDVAPPTVVGDPLVPEPTSLVLLSIAGMFGLAVQRSRG